MKLTLLALSLLALPAIAQTTVKDALVKHWKVSGEFTVAVASAMPADGYNFRPSPEEMNFGQLMAHIGMADANACSNASGLPKPELKGSVAEWAKDQKKDVDREAALEFLTSTFSFCDKAISGVTLEQLDKVVGPPARNLTGYEWLWSYFTHTAHHRGQAEVYLRVKGLKPPPYKF